MNALPRIELDAAAISAEYSKAAARIQEVAGEFAHHSVAAELHAMAARLEDVAWSWKVIAKQREKREGAK